MGATNQEMDKATCNEAGKNKSKHVESLQEIMLERSGKLRH